MPSSSDAISTKVTTILVEALGVESEEVVPEASLVKDLGVESIDFLDISFRVEREFGVRVESQELFPEIQDSDASASLEAIRVSDLVNFVTRKLAA